MLTKNMYPICARTFEQMQMSKKIKHFYNKLKPQLFDVTLRDGLQGLSKKEQDKYTITEKKNLYHRILFNQKPQKIEIGSIVSEKVLPIFSDSLDLLKYINNYEKEVTKTDTDYYIVIPNQEKLKEVISSVDINNINLHFSFITSISNSFQLKNTKMTLQQSDEDIYSMLYKLEENIKIVRNPKIKLYVSCINECPIEGKIDNDYIVHRLLNLSKMNVENICLSDTCGTMEIEDFEYIIETSLYFGLQPSKLSLHLHVKPGRENIIEQIIHKALDYKITIFDVSMLDSGGCSVTMKKGDLSPNLSYELYYKALYNYISKNI